ncbi:hypothetical protein PGTUg99_037273 [Puccinia graminis f. sp. tritici]|uniref:Uncharacterized protein n=1 Tax=Puccinia graminis f. sp. tritici TaxID=56615 RepID=A0A5B0SPV6_PUCGR|nr:hypothetical protein PGTUg99_037273 [Puccinia graminis f. sp. tritici]
MPLAKPIRANQRKQHAANARDRVVKLKGDIFQSTTILCEFLIFSSVTFMPALEPDRCDRLALEDLNLVKPRPGASTSSQLDDRLASSRAQGFESSAGTRNGGRFWALIASSDVAEKASLVNFFFSAQTWVILHTRRPWLRLLATLTSRGIPLSGPPNGVAQNKTRNAAHFDRLLMTRIQP